MLNKILEDIAGQLRQSGQYRIINKRNVLLIGYN